MEATKTERTPQLADKYVLRMPDGMREQISARAKANNRSMNAEIVGILQEAMGAKVPAGSNGIDVERLAESLKDRLADDLADRIAARLKAST